MLTEKLEVAAAKTKQEPGSGPTASSKRPVKEETIFDNPILKQAGRTAASIITRSLLGALGVSSSVRRRRSSSWF